MNLKKKISLKNIEEGDPKLVALWEVADATFDALESLLREIGHIPIQNDRQRESVRRWTLYLGTLFAEAFHASTLLAVATMPRAQVVLDRQLFEYSIRTQWLMKHPDEATRLLDSVQGFVQRELTSSSKLFDAVTRASLEKNYEDWKRDHADLDAKVSSRESFTAMAADVLGDRFNPELFWLYGLPSLIVHGKPHGIPDVHRLAGSNQLERSPNSNWFTSTDQLMKQSALRTSTGCFLLSVIVSMCPLWTALIIGWEMCWSSLELQRHKCKLDAAVNCTSARITFRDCRLSP